MTTALDRPLKREVLLGGQPFTLRISPTGVRIAPKGHHKGTEVSWDVILTLGQPKLARDERHTSKSDMPKAIAADIAREIRTANDALSRANASLLSAGTLPAELIAEVESDRVYGRVDGRSDWFIEPLLTVDELASILRISRPAASRLPIRCVTVAGETRYRQSEIREYIRLQSETQPRHRF